jgi:hypothetical protein
MDRDRKIIVWYNQALSMWTAMYNDDKKYRVGTPGYGTNKSSAVDDLKYQNTESKYTGN